MYIEIVSNREQLAKCTYYYQIEEQVKQYNQIDLKVYCDLLITAKRILGGII